MLKDKDLISIQQARELLRQADSAFQSFRTYSQERIDQIVRAMATAAEAQSRRLAEMAVEETAMGKVEDKFIKNQFASRHVFESIRNMKTVGVLSSDEKSGIMEVAMPVGVICGIIPTTNPTSSVIFKSLIALKAGNAIVFSPHPTARRCILAAADIMHQAAVSAGAPRGIIGCLQEITLDATRELMTHKLTALILATGGSDMVRAAYSSGKPAYGVGPGNVPAYIHSSADVSEAVAKILMSKTFDNGTICSSEQAVLADIGISNQVQQELARQNAYFLDETEAGKLARVLITPQGRISGKLVGRSAELIAQSAGISVPPGTRALVVKPRGIGPDFPLSREKLSPVLAYFEVNGPEDACLRCIDLLNLGGLGHSLVIHAQDESIIREFALKKPVSRMLVNTPSTHGAIGYSTNLAPSLTLGCGSIGGNVTSDNITATHLINIKRIARHRTDTSAPPTTETVVERSAPSLTTEEIRTLVSKAIANIKH